MNAVEMVKCLQQAVSEIATLPRGGPTNLRRFAEEARAALGDYYAYCGPRPWTPYDTIEGWFTEHIGTGERSFMGQSELHARMVAAYRNGPAVAVQPVPAVALLRMRDKVRSLAELGGAHVDPRSSVGMARCLVEEEGE